MISLDTNILVALLYREASTSAVVAALDGLGDMPLHIHISVYAELLAAPRMSQEVLDNFLQTYAITLDAATSPEEWFMAGRAFREYAERRRRSGGGQPRRLLVDFVVGAHAMHHGQTLLTLDPQHYRQGFPELRVIHPLQT